MRFCVIADSVSARGDVADKFGTDPRELAYEEKCGARVSLFEKSQQPRRDGGIGPVVKRQRDLFCDQACGKALRRTSGMSSVRRPTQPCRQRSPLPRAIRWARKSNASQGQKQRSAASGGELCSCLGVGPTRIGILARRRRRGQTSRAGNVPGAGSVYQSSKRVTLANLVELTADHEAITK